MMFPFMMKTQKYFGLKIYLLTEFHLSGKYLNEKKFKEIQELDINKIVPGHGPIISKKEAISPMIDYFDQLIFDIRNFHKSNKSLDFVLKNISQENKQGWLLFNDYHMGNITKAFTELEWE